MAQIASEWGAGKEIASWAQIWPRLQARLKTSKIDFREGDFDGQEHQWDIQV